MDNVEFIKNALTYLEKRIAVLDTKASILIALLVGSLAIIFNLSPKLNNLLLCICLILALGAILLLLMTIRPTWRLKIPLRKLKVTNYVMWPEEDLLEVEGEYKKRIKNLDDSAIQENYEKVHHITLQLIKLKYQYYRWACLVMRISIVLIILGVALAVVCPGIMQCGVSLITKS